ncbi:MAG: DUF2934 domain-containing protein [Planctomycetales bacterium]|nr:DUF2934 domain-containing protein [Planctomycetales bacterium]
MADFIRCRGCDSVLIEPLQAEVREPCPECGATNREFILDAANKLFFHELLGMKQKRAGEKKPILETKNGDSLFRKTGEWHKLVRIIDRANDRYYEFITNADGEVVRHVDEPLSEHYGRGSAKSQKHDFADVDIAVAAYYIWESEGCPDGRHIDHWFMGIENLKRCRAGVSLAY